MANTVSSLKRIRITERRTAINKQRKSRLRFQIRTMRRLCAERKVAQALEALPTCFSIIDRAAKWGIIKKNTAARYKSRLTARIRKIQASVVS